MNERIVHELVQRSPEWHEFRLSHYGASEAAAMLGMSKHITRAELLRAKHTGIAQEFSDWQQKHVLDYGHEVEAAARLLAEKILGEELYPVTYSRGQLSASCDGLTMDGAVAFEHKQYNASLFESVSRYELPDEHQPQCQQMMLVTGAESVMFVVSDGTLERFASMSVLPDPDWFERIQAGWKQFDIDLRNYQQVEGPPQSVVAAPEALPTLIVQLVGEVRSTNLAAWRDTVVARISAINTDLQTDEEFAVAEKTIKFLDDSEKKLDHAKAHALSQTSSIEELFRTIDALREEMRAKRLTLDRLVKSRKESIREEIRGGAASAYVAHIRLLNKRLGVQLSAGMPCADFGGVMKGKKTVASLRDAVDTELARVKIEANALADRVQINLDLLPTLAGEHIFLFPDTAQLVFKARDDFAALVKLRIAEHREKVERERLDMITSLTSLESARTAREAADLRAAAKVQGIAAGVHAKPPVPTVPTADEIIEVLAVHYGATWSMVVSWLVGRSAQIAAQARSAEPSAGSASSANSHPFSTSPTEGDLS